MRTASIRLSHAILSLSSSLSLEGWPYSNHQHRVAYIAAALAEELGLDDQDGNDLFFAALLHDVGKLAGPRLEERDSAKVEEEEANRGFRLLQGFAPLRRAANIIRHHPSPERAAENGEHSPSSFVRTRQLA